VDQSGSIRRRRRRFCVCTLALIRVVAIKPILKDEQRQGEMNNSELD
jgi:hypothetical protein